MSVTSSNIVNVEQYRYDLIDISRQAMSDLFEVNYLEMTKAYTSESSADVQKYGDVLSDLMTDLDALLNTNKYWMLGEWIKMARKHSSNVTEQKWWEFNARNQ